MANEGFPVYPRPGVFTSAEEPDFGESIQGAYSTGDQITIIYSNNETEVFPASNITADPNTGRLSFVSGDSTFTIREPREDDGAWLSLYSLFLPLEAVETLLDNGGRNNVALTEDQEENLDAFASDDSPYVLGVIYTNAGGRWLRTNGDWIQLGPNDSTFSDMMVMSIDPERAQEFIDLYDRNYVSVTDAEEYEIDGATADEE